MHCQDSLEESPHTCSHWDLHIQWCTVYACTHMQLIGSSAFLLERDKVVKKKSVNQCCVFEDK